MLFPGCSEKEVPGSSETGCYQSDRKVTFLMHSLFYCRSIFYPPTPQNKQFHFNNNKVSTFMDMFFSFNKMPFVVYWIMKALKLHDPLIANLIHTRPIQILKCHASHRTHREKKKEKFGNSEMYIQEHSLIINRMTRLALTIL